MFGLEPWAFGLAVGITLFAGFVKGAVGFAMPLLMISAFSAFLSPETALAGLILPTVVTNVSQAFRQGFAAAWGSVRKYWRLIVATVVFIVISAQFVRDIPTPVFLILLGVPVTVFALAQLTGRNLALKLEHQNRAEWLLGAIGGLYGGIAGVWGPPVLVYMLSIRADKRETVRVTGVIFLIGAVVLLAAHLQTGVMNAQTVPFSAALILPAMAGLLLGYRLQDRLPQERFRRWTQALLGLTGLNLIRGGLGF
ncbi:sulfite exporter TauE/SafE family protein [Aliigemmobacter aestuarii]|uniref:Probable membrane transporter protein n=1 Tax=Aliigemmobacter aestuarii TaxID=1445661 RepID=A0A4S3MRU6_9RHOB|nr:sulfite exporter TauE/SafE family protein [Gemmobacter aestuarii]THD85276.1 sulfite exporter TauE/SafE family protein [Gemmobacter aestuarii]